MNYLECVRFFKCARLVNKESIIKLFKILSLFIIFFAFTFLVYLLMKKQIIGYKSADVLIQAGHEGRTTGYTGAQSPYAKEMDWNRDVADEVTKILREAGVSVLRVGATMPIAKVKIALSIHFDGSTTPCGSGASIGYGNPSHETLANKWKNLYSTYYPFDWMNDNFTDNLSSYYGYKYVFSQKGFLVLELGELTCKKEAIWLRYRLKKIATLIAYFVAQELDVQGVFLPPLQSKEGLQNDEGFMY
jgi:N-acetylmuramoyl-L-alanine amidase